MGVGTTTLNVTYNDVATTNGNVNQYSLSLITNSSNEFNLKRYEYMYFKVNYVKIMFFNNNSVTTGLNYLLFNWANNHDYSGDQIIKSDNTKIISPYRTRSKVFTFIPPDMIVNAMGSTYSLKNFRTTAVISIPGWFYLNVIEDTAFRVEINLIFRGSQDFSVGTKLNNQLIKIVEEEKNKNMEQIKMLELENKISLEQVPKENEIQSEENNNLENEIKNLELKLKFLKMEKENKEN